MDCIRGILRFLSTLVSEWNTEESEEEDYSTPNCGRQRLARTFTHEEEVTLLEALLRYRLEKMCDPRHNFADFHEDFKTSVRFPNLRKSQVERRIRRLKEKFLNNWSLGKEQFNDRHEMVTYKFYKRIWGDDENQQ